MIEARKVDKFTFEEGGVLLSAPSGVRVRDIIFCPKIENAMHHVVWNKPRKLGGPDCHSFFLLNGKRFDAVNDFKEA